MTVDAVIVMPARVGRKRDLMGREVKGCGIDGGEAERKRKGKRECCKATGAIPCLVEPWTERESG